MVQTFSDNDKIYNVDMMFAYVNTHKYPIINVPLKNLSKVLYDKSWGNPSKNIYYSPNQVINNLKNITEIY